MKKFLTTTVALLLTVSIITSGVYALTPVYKVSDSYKSSSFYKQLTAVKLTGNYVDDIANVALSQVNYHESDSADDLTGNAQGSSDFTEYCSWFGYTTGWCAIFISWCARQAGIPESIISNNATADGKGGNFGEKKIYSFSQHQPQKGDIIYVNNDSDPDADHVGIVYDVDDNFIYAVEGNTSQQVYDIKYYRTSGRQFFYNNTQIVYYGVPNYGVTGTKALQKIFVSGDADCDGKVTSFDALFTLQCAAGLTKPSQEQFRRGDVNADGVLNSFDALQILTLATK